VISRWRVLPLPLVQPKLQGRRIGGSGIMPAGLSTLRDNRVYPPNNRLVLNSVTSEAYCLNQLGYGVPTSALKYWSPLKCIFKSNSMFKVRQ
ncbi:hypothetical protein L9F63_004312, partial [Diploptera punctata]